MKANDYRGKRFGNLIAIERDENAPNGRAIWKCLCDCGNITYVRSGNLQSGEVKSCGCLRHKKAHNRTHGMSKSRLYKEWAGMIARCENANISAYKFYGAKGIKVCAEWRKSFEAFRDWAFLNGYSDELTIERLDFRKGYSPENCSWIPKAEQMKNTSRNVCITYKGKTQILDDWCKELGLDYKRTHNRLSKMGWSVERAFTEPVNANKRNMAARKKEGD